MFPIIDHILRVLDQNYLYINNIRMNGGRKWSMKYKKSINCRRPKGFSQRQHCKYGRRTRKQNKK
jgi:hypothetical protein